METLERKTEMAIQVQAYVDEVLLQIDRRLSP
jgi:hypothetical protein